MSTFYNTNQPQTVTSNTGLFGNNSNQLNFQGVGLNNQQGTQNLLLNNVQQPTVLDSRSTVRQLTSLVPEWKGHFDLADHLMTSQEQTLTNVSMLVTQLQNIYENLLSTFDFSKTSLNDINLQQDKLNNDLSERLKYQDLQNLVTIKSRRLCEVIIGNNPNTDVSSAFRIPNHINVQVSKELYERVRNLRNEIDFIQNEVQLLKEIDVFQAPTFIESVLNSHDSRITNLGDSLTKLLNRAETVLNKDLKREVWSGLTVDSSTLRKNFLDAIGLEQTKTETDNIPLTEVKKQINYLKKFNSSYNDPNLQYMRDYGYNIKDLLVNTVPNQSLMMPSPNFQTNGFNAVTGTGLFGQQFTQNQQPFGTSTSTGFGSNTGTAFGGTTSTGFGFGQPGLGTTQPSAGLSPFGSSANLLQSSTGSSSNLYAHQFQKQQPVGSTQFGMTSGLGSTGFGITTTGVTGTGTGFGTTTQTPFGVSSGTTGVGLFGSNTTQPGTTSTGFGNSTGTTGFGSTSTTATPGFGSTAQTTTGFGSNTTGGSGLFGSSTQTGTGSGLFGSSTTQTSGLGSTGFGTTTTQPSTGLFGSTTTTGSGLFGSAQNQTSNLFGHSSTGSASSANLLGSGTTQRSTGLFGSTTGTGTGFGSTNTSTGFGTTSGTTGGGLFGSTTNTGTTGLGGTGFGTTTTSGPFGTSTSTGFGSNTGTAFGSSTTSGTGLFGNTSSNTGFGSTTGTGLFGSSSTTGTGFGSGTTGVGLFGSSNQTGTGFGSSTTSTGLFGSTSSSTSLFGSTTQTKTPGTELALYTNPNPGLPLNRS